MMHGVDQLHFAWLAVRSQPQRSALTGLGIAIGIAAIVLLLAIGSGLRQYVLGEFSQFGTNLLQVTPGRHTTLGMSGAMINTVRPLSLDDAQALSTLPGVQAVVPSLFGNVAVEAGRRSRRVMAIGVGSDMPAVWRFAVAHGAFLPPDDARHPRAFAVLGERLWRELYGGSSPLGGIVRVGGDRYRVLGVMAKKGQFLGVDLDDAIYLPVARGLQLFDREGLMQIDVQFAPERPAIAVAESVRRTLAARHGIDDCSVTTQQQMLDVMGSVLDMLATAVAGLGAISLLVGGIGILTIMTIALRERTAEIGLLRALGARRLEVGRLFLGEAAMLTAVGGTIGLGTGAGVVALLHALVPALPLTIVGWHVAVAEGVSLLIGLAAGALPALRAASLDPLQALRAE